MFIETEETPNPSTLKFLPGCDVMPSGTAYFASSEEAKDKSPLAVRLFTLACVKSVFFGDRFISVTKVDDLDWEVCKPPVLGAIMEHFIAREPVINQSAVAQEEDTDAEEDAVVSQIKELLNTRVRPAVAQDGGDIIYRGYEQGIVYLELWGACAGCPAAAITLKNGVENMLRYYIPEVLEVRPVGMDLAEVDPFSWQLT